VVVKVLLFLAETSLPAVAFLDVGQGDAIFLRTPKGLDILIDGGPDDSVLSCLAGHMPFWDRDLEVVILTHPHADHLGGLIDTVSRYKIKNFATVDLRNDTGAFRALIDQLKKQNIKIRYLYAGDRFVFKDGVSLDIVGPSRGFLELTSPTGTIGEKSEFANIESLFKYKDFSILLTGDSQAVELDEAIESGRITKVDVLQVPHHGSKTGLNSDILDVLSPELAVVSVGKNNKYGHPTEFILKILRDKPALPAGKDIMILRTDENGETEIITDGGKWGVR